MSSTPELEPCQLDIVDERCDNAPCDDCKRLKKNGTFAAIAAFELSRP